MPKTSSESNVPHTRSTLHGPTMGTRWSVSVDAPAR
jgi:thiamine biosynthesis lipoprotein